MCREDFAGSKVLSTKLDDRPEQVRFNPGGSTAVCSFYESEFFCVVDLAVDKMLLNTSELEE